MQAWERLEKAEHERGVALRKELIRQEKLELLAQRFDHKTTMRQAWLNENQRLVSQVGSQDQTKTSQPKIMLQCENIFPLLKSIWPLQLQYSCVASTEVTEVNKPGLLIWG